MMKFLAVFFALVAVGSCNNQWNLYQLGQAIESPHTDPALKPYLIQALDELYDAMFNGEPVQYVTITIPASAAVAADEPAAPAMEVTSWTLPELDAALSDHNINPVLIPYLEHALDTMMYNIYNGIHMEFVVVAIPAGLSPVAPAPVAPVAPVDAVAPGPVIPMPTYPVNPAPVAGPAESNPLVQLIVNVNTQAAAAPAPVPKPVPEPIEAPESPIYPPGPAIITEPVVPAPVIIPAPVLPAPVVPSPVIIPAPVLPSPIKPPTPVIISPVDA